MSTSTYAMNGSSRSFSGGGPGQSVNPINAAFAGGTYAPARTPTDVGGGFSTPSAAGGPPPNFGTPAAAFARNDRGSNIRMCALTPSTLKPTHTTHARTLLWVNG